MDSKVSRFDGIELPVAGGGTLVYEIRKSGRSLSAVRGVQSAFDLLPDAVFCVDRASMTFSDVNRAACDTLGYARHELLAAGPYRISPAEDIDALARRLDASAGDEAATVVLRTRQWKKDGPQFPVEWHASSVPGSAGRRWIVVARRLDGAFAVGCPPQHVDADGLGLPGHDPLTGLPDRRLFERRLNRALARKQRHDEYEFAVCFIDLDNFKAVNDSLGHLCGDRVLCEVARRLSGSVRPGDMVARFGGDEFTVLIDDLRDETDARLIAARICRQLEPAVAAGRRPVRVTASIGIALSSRDCPRFESLLGDADRAMYRVKQRGGANFVFRNDLP